MFGTTTTAKPNRLRMTEARNSDGAVTTSASRSAGAASRPIALKEFPRLRHPGS